MLTPRQNLIETIKGGNPDRFVKQFEFFTYAPDPLSRQYPFPVKGGPDTVDGWGVTDRWPEGVVASFPVHDDEHKVVKDIKKWRDVVRHPNLDLPEEAWVSAIEADKQANRDEMFFATGVFPGVFETLHYLMGMTDALINFVEEPEEMHALIDYISDYLCKYSDMIASHIKPDMLMFSDDLGSSRNSFISPGMFEEFLLPAYKKVFGRYRENGCELIYLHNDSYSANLVPQMIEAGIDIWQGCVTNNNVPELVKKYCGQISFMGDIDNSLVDKADWTKELVEREVRRACENNGKFYFIPCMTMAISPGVYPGVFEYISECIDKMSEELTSNGSWQSLQTK